MAGSSFFPTLTPVKTSGNWTYTISGGFFLGCFLKTYTELGITTSSTGAYCSDVQSENYPTGISLIAGNTCCAGSSGGGTWVANTNASTTSVTFRIFRNASATADIIVNLIIFGKVTVPT